MRGSLLMKPLDELHFLSPQATEDNDDLDGFTRGRLLMGPLDELYLVSPNSAPLPWGEGESCSALGLQPGVISIRGGAGLVQTSRTRADEQRGTASQRRREREHWHQAFSKTRGQSADQPVRQHRAEAGTNEHEQRLRRRAQGRAGDAIDQHADAGEVKHV